MVKKDWTREQIGRMTLTDLRMLLQEHAPPPTGSTEVERPKSAQEAKARKARVLARRESWEE